MTTDTLLTRWRICGLFFLLTTINYMDRQVFGILSPLLQINMGWTESQYGILVASFTCTYAISQFVSGKWFDRIGVKNGLAIALIGWSLAMVGHAFAYSLMGFILARAFLGLMEGGNFPGALKGIAEWFPKKERAFATGIVNAGSNVGLIAAAIIVPFICQHYGWRITYVFQGLLGSICIYFWIKNYRYKQLPQQKMNLFANSEHALSFSSLLSSKQVWAFALGKFLTDPVWWFYLYWLPKYFTQEFHITLGTITLPLIIIYVIADIGSVGGGLIVMSFMKHGKTLPQARQLALRYCTLLIIPTLLLPWCQHIWMVVTLMSLAAAGHQGWSSNLFNLPSDVFPQQMIGTIVGFGSFLGACGGIFFQIAVGYFLESHHNHYAPIFILCVFAYIIALFFIQFFMYKHPCSTAYKVNRATCQ